MSKKSEILDKQYEYMTANDLLIDVQNVSMHYLTHNRSINSLKEYVIAKVKGQLRMEDKWVLRNVNLQVKKGESLGLIGRNGAGKSTLLRILAGIIEPTKGTVTTHGNIVPLLKLGAGFDMEATAKENIFLNGAIMGISHREMEKKCDSIIEFSELGDHLDKPLKEYSSGMLSRLGFAIAVDVSPDIVLLDEVLAVGDAPFQKKCVAKMKELQEKGATFIVVSHSERSIIEMCQKAVWLRETRICDYGDAEPIVKEYQKWCSENRENPELKK